MDVVRRIRIFLASPADVAEERDVAQSVIRRLGNDPWIGARFALQPVAWDNEGAQIPLLANFDPQTAVTKGIASPADCDVVIGIFWSRMGTPLPSSYDLPDGRSFRSGTEWEIVNALGSEADPPPSVLVYFREDHRRIDPASPTVEDDLAQARQVDDFRSSLEGARLGINRYREPVHLATLLEEHLRSIIQRLDRTEAPAAQLARLATVERGWATGDDGPGLVAIGLDGRNLPHLRRAAARELRRLVEVGELHQAEIDQLVAELDTLLLEPDVATAKATLALAYALKRCGALELVALGPALAHPSYDVRGSLLKLVLEDRDEPQRFGFLLGIRTFSYHAPIRVLTDAVADQGESLTAGERQAARELVLRFLDHKGVSTQTTSRLRAVADRLA